MKKEGLKKFPFSDKDQLNVIMDVLGTPTEEDLSFVTDQTALTYLAEFPTHNNKIDFKKMFPYANDQCLDLMKIMIQFNPFFRPSVEECLAHPYFTKIRKAEKEVKSENLVELDIDKAETEMSIKELRKIVVSEIAYYKKKKLQYGAANFLNV